MTREENVKNLLSELIDMIDNGSQRDLDRADEIGTSIIKLLEPKTGHWIMTENTNWYDAYFKCSCCGREIDIPYDLRNQVINKYPYCHCGAKMVEPQESEE